MLHGRQFREQDFQPMYSHSPNQATDVMLVQLLNLPADVSSYKVKLDGQEINIVNKNSIRTTSISIPSLRKETPWNENSAFIF